MNTIFHNIIQTFLELYVDDIIVKSDEFSIHLKHLKNVIYTKMLSQLESNPLA